MTTETTGDDHQVRVLIVDDTPDIRMLLRFTLERHPGFVVVGEAGNGHEAHARAREQPPDLVLLDLAMPVMDGLAALPGLRRIVPAAASRCGHTCNVSSALIDARASTRLRSLSSPAASGGSARAGAASSSVALRPAASRARARLAPTRPPPTIRMSVRCVIPE